MTTEATAPALPMTDEQIRQRQSEAVALLDELLAVALPPAHWRISPVSFGATDNPRLAGQISSYERPEHSVREDLAAWAKFFGTGIEEERERRYTAAYVRVDHGDVQIEIWARVDKEPAAGEV